MEPSSASKLKNMFAVFKRGSASKTPSNKNASHNMNHDNGREMQGKRLFTFSPAKTQGPTSARNQHDSIHESDIDLIPAHITAPSMATDSSSIGRCDDTSAIKVVVRVRPRNDREASMGGAIYVRSTDSTSLRLGQPEPHSFTFDHVAEEQASQEDVFQAAGKPIVDSCLRGYNGCLLAYGQTGSGKTHTMLGPTESLAATSLGNHSQRGLIQRIFEHLFASIDTTEDTKISCSFLEIYNETISDLLSDAGSVHHLPIREDTRRGVFVEGLREERVQNVDDVASLLQRGISNRRVGETLMNERSSRSHSVFTATVERRVIQPGTKTNSILTSRIHLVDLAGSERQKHSGAAGERLREASSINKSLSTLGLVIMSLVDQQAGRQRHIPYRDSKLTFLLQDSLGGNAKTVLIAAVSPASVNAAETLSTLRFADGAKRIKNRAVVNEGEVEGDVEMLKLEIKRLKEEMSMMKNTESSVHFLAENNNKDDPAVRRALLGALRREEAAAEQILCMKAELETMGQLVAAKDSDVQRTHMMLKLKESRLARLGVNGAGETVDETVVALQQEITSLKLKLESHPEVKRFAVENLHLSQEVARLEKIIDVDEIELLRNDVADLRHEMLRMSAALEKTEDSVARAVADAEAHRAAKERAEARMHQEIQNASSQRQASQSDKNGSGDDAGPALKQHIAELVAENDTLRLKAAEADVTREEAVKMCALAAGLESECEKLKMDLGEKISSAEELDVTLRGTVEKLGIAWDEIAHLEKEMESVVGENSRLQTECDAANDRINDLTAALDSTEQGCRDYAEEAVSLKIALERALCTNEEIQTALKTERCWAVSAEETVAKLETALENAKADAIQAENALHAEHERVEEATARAEQVSMSLESAQKRVTLLTEEVSVTSKDLIAASMSLKDSKEQVESLQNALTRSQKKCADLEKELHQVEESKDELAYELSDKSATLMEVKERLAATQASLAAVKESRDVLERRKIELTVELENAISVGNIAERERAALSRKISLLEEELDEANAKAQAGQEGPLESQQQLLLARAEVKETSDELVKAKAAASKMTALMKEKEDELSRVRAAMAAEVSDAAQHVQELLAAQARAEAAERRAAELSNLQQMPRRVST